MSPWIAFTALTIAVLLLLVWPLLRRSGKSAARADYDLMVFRDQLAEVDRDLESGVIQADQAEAARLEIKHRMLRAGRQRGTEIIGRPPARTMVAAVVAVAVPAGAFGLYGVIGAPAIPDMPYAEVQAPQLGEEHQGAADIEAMVEKVGSAAGRQPRRFLGVGPVGPLLQDAGAL
ncbi:MAG: c-type cytochrome biogenesis protein CcmI [Magnetospirillum sp.]|nr:c-type cytochrome biogenesis protein CcmI [Magnetospirillum sp.]